MELPFVAVRLEVACGTCGETYGGFCDVARCQVETLLGHITYTGMVNRNLLPILDACNKFARKKQLVSGSRSGRW